MRAALFVHAGAVMSNAPALYHYYEHERRYVRG